MYAGTGDSISKMFPSLELTGGIQCKIRCRNKTSSRGMYALADYVVVSCDGCLMLSSNSMHHHSSILQIVIG